MAGKEYTAKDKIFSMGDTLIRGSLKKLIKEHDLPPIVFHSLRHTSVTYKLKLKGGDVKAVQGDSGHAQVSIKGCGIAAGTASYHDHVVNMLHSSCFLRLVL